MTHRKLEDLQIPRAYGIAPVSRRYPLADAVEVVPLEAVTAELLLGESAATQRLPSCLRR